MTMQYENIVVAGSSTLGPEQQNDVLVIVCPAPYVVCVVGGSGMSCNFSDVPAAGVGCPGVGFVW